MNLRVVHNLSSSGGTVFSKCLASQPGVVLTSELSPNSPIFKINQFTPFDPFMAVGEDRKLFSKEVLRDEWRRRVEVFDREVRALGKKTILRDHAHSEFLFGDVYELDWSGLFPEFDLKEVLLIRHPLDSYLSMRASKFLTSVENFEEYCERIKRFLDRYQSSFLVRYEDFVENPETWVRKACEVLAIEFDPTFLENFHRKRLTGDSGRAVDSPELSAQKRREVNENIRQECERSESYQQLCSLLHYSEGTRSAPRKKTFSPDDTFGFRDLLKLKS